MKLEIVPPMRTNVPPMCTNHPESGSAARLITPYAHQSAQKTALLCPLCVPPNRLPRPAGIGGRHRKGSKQRAAPNEIEVSS